MRGGGEGVKKKYSRRRSFPVIEGLSPFRCKDELCLGSAELSDDSGLSTTAKAVEVNDYSEDSTYTSKTNLLSSSQSRRRYYWQGEG